MIVRQIVVVLLLILLLLQARIPQQHFAWVLDQDLVPQVQVQAEVVANQEVNLVQAQAAAAYVPATEQHVDGHHLMDLHGH
jgi:hypothetical protein